MSNYSYKNNNANTDQLVFAADEPDVQYLNTEFQRSLYTGNNVTRLQGNDSVRYAKWSGQSDDGKKWSENLPDGQSAFPFDGASDVRIRIIDSTINEIVSTMTTGFERSTLRVSGVDVGDSASSAVATNLMTWVRDNKLKSELSKEAELLCNYGQQYGWAVAHVAWEQRTGVRTQKITIEEVNQMAAQVAQQNPQSVIASMPQMIMNPEMEEQAASIVTTLMEDISMKDARNLIKGLREDGVGEYDQEYVQKNLPCITALKPFDEVAFPPETIDLQRARVIYRRQYFTEVELRSMVENDGWDKEFVEQACITQGRQSWYNNPNMVATALNPVGALRNDHLIEIVYAYARQLDKNGIAGIYFTVFCPLLGSELYGKHERLDYAHGEYPFVEYRRERLRRPIVECRGIPEIGFTDQEEIKAQCDSMRDRTALTTLPPILVKKRVGMINKIGPAVQLSVTAGDDYTFLQPPAASMNEAMLVIKQAEARHANYFGLIHPDVNPLKQQLIMQSNMNNWLGIWNKIFSQTFQLCLQYMPQAEIERIAGGVLPSNLSEIANQFDFVLKFDARELSTDFVLEKLKALSTFAIPNDVGGVIDRNKLTMAIMSAISPDASKDMLVDQQGASQKMYRDVQTDIAMMMLGNEAVYTENDPTAATKLQYTQDIVSKNPKAQQAAQQDPQFQQLMQNYVKNLQFSQQQQQNKQIGRIGVSPVSQQQAPMQQNNNQPQQQ